ncbi:MAG: flavodoxin family protein [Candidatus Hermodarchaeota archaeon]
MSRILIVYYSKSGNTARMADYIAEGVKKEKDVEVEVKTVKETKVTELLDTDAIILGSPTYYGSMAAEIKQFIDESVKFHGKLEGKIGGAFSSSGIIGGGNETTILDILKALLVHGIIIQGTSKGSHYGPVAIGKPDDRSRKLCVDYGKRIAKLVLKTIHN